jgi:hypothetical protein
MNRAMRKIRTFLALGRKRQSLIGQLIFLPLVIALGFRLFGVRQTQRYLRIWACRGHAKRLSSEPGTAIANVLRAQRLVKRKTGIQGTCLVRSLAAWALLLRRGVATDLRIGVRRSEGKLEGHAWLQWDGEPINENAATLATYSAYQQPISFDGPIVRGKGAGNGSFPPAPYSP